MARTDFLTKQRKEITTRLDQLRPHYEEYLTLEKAQQALEQLGDPIRRGARASAGQAGPGRPRKKGTASRPATRRRTGNTRAEQALAAIRAQPGISVSDLAKKLGIRPNYLYRVTAGLEQEKLIKRRGKGFHPA